MLQSICVLISAGCGVIPRFNEDNAIGALQALRSAQENFKSNQGRYGTRAELAASYSGIPASREHGYLFTLEVNPETYVALATPTAFKERAISLHLDQSGTIRGMYKKGEQANVMDPVLHGKGINPHLPAP